MKMEYPNISTRMVDEWMYNNDMKGVWNIPIPKNKKKVMVRYNGKTMQMNMRYLGSDKFANQKTYDVWQIDLPGRDTMLSSTYMFSNRQRCQGPFNFYMFLDEKVFKLYKGPQEFVVLE